MKKNYLDTCIWLNLFKKETSTRGVPFWKLAKDFIEDVEDKGGNILVSTIVLKELYYKVGDRFNEIKEEFQATETITIVKTSSIDYELARKFEQAHGLLSFYDYLHVALAKRFNAILITRDRDLIVFARKHVEVYRPEELLR
mgnify:CR=1 FL=1|jgi:predicted nucleic acid-binding protein